MAFLIKSFHSPSNGSPKRIHFWQTPWVVPIYENWREVGGWITSSLGGTQYPTQQEAESVNLIRGLGGEVVNADRYLTPPTPQ